MSIKNENINILKVTGKKAARIATTLTLSLFLILTFVLSSSIHNVSNYLFLSFFSFGILWLIVWVISRVYLRNNATNNSETIGSQKRHKKILEKGNEPKRKIDFAEKQFQEYKRPSGGKEEESEYDALPLDKLISSIDIDVVEYDGVMSLKRNNQIIDNLKFFDKEELRSYLVKLIVKEKKVQEENSKYPTLKLYERIRFSSDFLRERGYVYVYINNQFRLINKSCGSYLDIGYGNHLSSKELDRHIEILGEKRSFDELNMIGEGFYIGGKFEPRSANPTDEYVYYFGESIDGVISFLDHGSQNGGCFKPDMPRRTCNPWKDRHGRLEHFGSLISNNHYTPDRTPM